MTEMQYFIFFVIFLAFVFDFINGFHDAANSIATMVATGALKPIWAVAWAAFFNFIAFLVFNLNVASTIGTGLIQPHIVTPYLIFAALTGAIFWNLITWYFGLPSSSSHALIGGLFGAAIVKAGWGTVNQVGFYKVVTSIVLSPILGLILGLTLMSLMHRFTHQINTEKVEKWSKRMQFLAGALLSLGHGGNDAQKTMGIIAVLLFSSHLIGNNFHVPFWVVISCNSVMALGTLCGGWRIINTMGKKITDLTPLSGGCAATGAAITLFTANNFGIPVSTTHTVTGSIIGVGTQKGIFGTHWDTVRRIIWAWVLTIPAAGCVAGGLMWLRYFLPKFI